MAELMQDEALKTLDKNAALVIEECTNLKLGLEFTTEEEINMCQAWDEHYEDGRNEGRNEGIEIGRSNERKEMAVELLKKNILPLDEVAALTKLSTDTVAALQQEILQKV